MENKENRIMESIMRALLMYDNGGLQIKGRIVVFSNLTRARLR
jgi:hypothetical protein